jgi:hypothetical protein
LYSPTEKENRTSAQNLVFRNARITKKFKIPPKYGHRKLVPCVKPSTRLARALCIEEQYKQMTEQNTVEAAWLINDYDGNQ